jgi:hypothetical protein
MKFQSSDKKLKRLCRSSKVQVVYSWQRIGKYLAFYVTKRYRRDNPLSLSR